MKIFECFIIVMNKIMMIIEVWMLNIKYVNLEFNGKKNRDKC